MAEAHEYIDFKDDVPATWDLCVKIATIIEMTGETARIDLNGEQIADVPIFYHCQDDQDTANGHTAFEADDEVVVLAYNDRRPGLAGKSFEIVGFRDGLKLCKKYFMTILCGNYDEVLIPTYPSNASDDQKFKVGDKVFFNDISRGVVRLIDGESLIGLFAYRFEGGELIENKKGAEATVEYCMTHDYRWNYNAWHLKSLFSTMSLEQESVLPIIGPGDNPPAGRVACNGMIISTTWHKTLDALTLCAYTYKFIGDPTIYWGLTASFNGERCTFGETKRQAIDGMVRSIAGINYFIGFDPFMERGTYKFSLAAQSTTRRLRVYSLFDEAGLNFENEDNFLIQSTDMDFYDESAKLCGLHMRKSIWCKFGTHKYFETSQDRASAHTPYGDTGRLTDCLWDHLRHTIRWVWDEYQYSENRELGCQNVDQWGYDYYTAAFCTVYSDGSYVGDACEGIKFSGGAMEKKEVTLSPCAAPVTCYYFTGPDTGTRKTKTYNIIMRDAGETLITYKTFMRICGIYLKRGTLKYSGGSAKYSLLFSADGSYQRTNSCCYSVCYLEGTEEAFEVEEIKLICAADGAACGEYKKYNYHTVYDPNGFDSCEAAMDNEPETVRFGNDFLAGMASKFPHDFGVLAWFMGGEDCEERDIQQAILYRGAIQKETGGMIEDEDYDRMRGLFLKTAIPNTEC